jgi:hypothetical protein
MTNIEIVVTELDDQPDNLTYILSEFIDDDVDAHEEYDSYTLKQLTYICEYYGISKKMKLKCNTPRCEIVNTLIYFENLPINYVIVNRRRQLWFYLSELKSDKYLKKFIFF